MPQYQIVGTQQKLNKRPVSSPSANPKSGTFQVVGTEQKLSHTPISSPSANPPSGQFQIVGTESKLNRTPVKGWGSATHLPMSERAIAQSQNAAHRGKRKR